LIHLNILIIILYVRGDNSPPEGHVIIAKLRNLEYTDKNQIVDDLWVVLVNTTIVNAFIFMTIIRVLYLYQVLSNQANGICDTFCHYGTKLFMKG